jgi:integrase
MKPTKQENGRWKAGVSTATGRGAPRTFRTFDTRAEALRWQTEVRAQVQRGAWSTLPDDVTFSQWAATWLGRLEVSPGTRDSYTAHLARLTPALGEYRLGQLRRPMLERHLSSLTGSPSYRAQTHSVLAIVLKAAMTEGLIRTNPILGVKPPTVQRREVKVLTAPQVRRLLLAVDPRCRTMLLVGIGTGLRQAELFGLRRDRVEFLHRTVAVEEQVTTGGGRPPALTGTLKTPSSRRRIPVPDAVLEALSVHLAEHPDLDVLFVKPRSGALWHRGHFNLQVWKPALKAAGLDASLGMHVLRHTYASHLIAAGLHPRVIQARLGHASIVETMDTYGHLFPDGDDATRTALDGLFQNAGSTWGAPVTTAHPL